MNPQLIKKYLFYFILILVAVSIVKVANTSGDFKIFLGAAQLISENKSPYHEWIFVSEGNLGLYYYSPLWAVILIPFNLIPHFITNLIWLIANVYFLYRITRFLISCTESLNISQKQLNWILIVAAAMSFRFALYNFGMIQMTIFLLWGILESLDLIRKEKFLLAGMLLALVINIKLLPMVFIPYLIYRREFKTVVSALICSILFIFLPAIVVGWSGNIFLLSEWWSVINPSNPEHLLESELGPHSLTALIPSLLTITDGNLPNTRNIFNLEIGLTNFIMNGIRFFLIFLTCYFLKWPPFKKTESRMHQLWEVCYILLLIPLIFPHQQKYAFLMVLPAQFYLASVIIFVYPVHKIIMSRLKWNSIIISIALSFALMTLSTDGLVGRDLNKLSQHYKTITYGTLILILPLLLGSDKLFEKARIHLLFKQQETG